MRLIMYIYALLDYKNKIRRLQAIIQQRNKLQKHNDVSTKQSIHITKRNRHNGEQHVSLACFATVNDLMYSLYEQRDMQGTKIQNTKRQQKQ